MCSYETTWLGQPAIALETPLLRFVTVPSMGAKIVSLYDRQAQREWLLPPSGRAFQPVGYGASFVDQDMSGWDEIFPTIDACNYPIEGVYHGIALPDHGEVWSLPWQIESVTEDSISLSTVGIAVPYRLTRTVRARSRRKRYDSCRRKVASTSCWARSRSQRNSRGTRCLTTRKRST